MSMWRPLRKVAVSKDTDVEIREQMNHRERGLCREVVKWSKVVTSDEN
jgi:hypothetical protein